ncbi:MAG: hypothetical protein ACP5PJ_10340, partial [Acidimicrobiales bacterium]
MNVVQRSESPLAECVGSIAANLASQQLRSGLIPWFRGGHGDPWNHTEALLALLASGYEKEASHAMEWLLDHQNADGSFCQYYLERGVEEPRRDLNVMAYPLVAAWIFVASNRLGRRRADLVAMSARIVRYLLHAQRPDGTFPFAIDPDGRPHDMALLTANASIATSLEAGRRLLAVSGHDTRAIDRGLEQLRAALVASPSRFVDKSDWAMDSYYLHFAGVNDPDRLSHDRRRVLVRHLDRSRGIRCLGSKSWYTSAESAEFAMALLLSGDRAGACALLRSLRWFIEPSGGVLTGRTAPSGVSFPHGEHTTYSQAAVILADSLYASGAKGSFHEGIRQVT